jgi:putative transposase
VICTSSRLVESPAALLGTPRARDCFVRILDEVRCRHAFKLIGYVVMPEHVHILLSEPKEGTPSKVLQVLKQKVSSALRGSRAAGDASAFWQRRFYDFNVWSTEKLAEKLDYMHANPVKRKLVVHPKDWPWSSWSYYVKGEGLIRMDSVEESAAGMIQQAEKKQTQNPHP